MAALVLVGHLPLSVVLCCVVVVVFLAIDKLDYDKYHHDELRCCDKVLLSAARLLVVRYPLGVTFGFVAIVQSVEMAEILALNALACSQLLVM